MSTQPVAICDQFIFFRLLSWKRDVSGNRSTLRLTCSFNLFTSTWYISARSLSTWFVFHEKKFGFLYVVGKGLNDTTSNLTLIIRMIRHKRCTSGVQLVNNFQCPDLSLPTHFMTLFSLKLHMYLSIAVVQIPIFSTIGSIPISRIFPIYFPPALLDDWQLLK